MWGWQERERKIESFIWGDKFKEYEKFCAY
jgi:hypothetical protein